MQQNCYFYSSICGNCDHFRLHYIWDGSRFIPTGVGHCVYPRLKDRFIGQSCRNWRPQPHAGNKPETP